MEELTGEEKSLYDLQGSTYQFANAKEFVHSMIDLCENYLKEDEVKRNSNRTENWFSVKAEGYLDGRGYYVRIDNRWSHIIMDFKVIRKSEQNNALELELDWFDLWILSENQDLGEREEMLAKMELFDTEEAEEEQVESIKQNELFEHWWKYGRVNEYFYSCTMELSID